MYRYGDNIYHTDPNTDEYIQEDLFHSLPSGVLSPENLQRDTGRTDRVLIGSEFAYWGGAGPTIPKSLSDFVVLRQGHKCRFAADRINALLNWIGTLPERGYVGEPAHWRYL